MPCYHPLKAVKSTERSEKTGKHLIAFSSTKALVQGHFLLLPCGQCIGCRADRSQSWGIRCTHEAQMHDASCFFTLTYDDENVPADYSVKLSDWQKFIRRTRKRIGLKGLRFAGGGEYGELGLRPHYHGLFFNYDFPDKRYLQKRNGNVVYSSELLRELWPYGSSELGEVTHASAAYVARYSLKKVTGKRADDHYWRVSPVDGEAHRVSPEFFTMSRRPGIGTAWFEKFGKDAFSSSVVVSSPFPNRVGRVASVSEGVIADGRKARPPRFYLDKLSEAEREAVKRQRKRASLRPEARANSTPDRLAVREEIHEDRMKRLIRPLK